MASVDCYNDSCLCFSSDEVSVKIGEQLKLDVLLLNADKVQHQSRRSTGWTEVWRRTDGVQSERMIIRDGNLIINEFTPRDAGSYSVLDPDGELLITVKVKGDLTLFKSTCTAEVYSLRVEQIINAIFQYPLQLKN